MDRKNILVINPGSTSTKVAVFNNKEKVILNSIDHKPDDLEKFNSIVDQYEYRLNLILNWLKEEGIETSSLRAVVGRGGLLRPMPGGTYLVTEKMIEDLRKGVQGEHASNLGGILAKGIADKEGIKAYIVDPVAVDEFDEVARISGMPEIKRKSLLHALNIKAVSHRLADELNKELKELNLIVAHLGGGISVAPVKKGRIVDVNNANEMGPFSPERTGSLPVGDLAKMCFSGKYTYKEIKTKIKGKGGLVGYLGTNDAREVTKMIENGDKKAKLIFEAMGYQIAKEIAAMATVLNGDVNHIILTGGLSYSKLLTEYIKDMVEFIAQITIYPGGDEQEALNNGVLRVLEGKEEAKIYENEVKIDD
ncbi:butyrate kinase [Caldisalinibacter kiritimatiensis]|uniref:Probable butyrate kinase n=1 Tax=Caldisalinibacter kiritimatiensis TaxID=1304284 RepID=R1CLQ8_9FIRM|nr:butyrate kinase [Caldisalinibacter kiritimatiensis]EOC99640.1 Butyrate kinase [Caldisalinibacter kiritimatiensis]